MRLLGIDYGERRIGLAYADELGLAVPVTPAAQSSEPLRLDAIADEVRRRRIEALVVGYPYNMDGSVGFKAREVDAFIERLGTRIPLPIHRMDETLSTNAAQRGLEETGRKGKRDRRVRSSGDVDSRAAAIILQDYIDAHGLVQPAAFPDFGDEGEEED